MKPEEISNLIRARRSVYPNNFSDEKVDNQIINEMLENANWAPTHRLTEPWRFVVFEGDGIRKFAEFQSNLYKNSAEKRGAFDEKKFIKLQKKPLSCSHIIAIGMNRDSKESVPEVEEIAAVSCAVQNMWLTAAAFGVGCYWSTGGVTYDPRAKEFFGLKEDDKLMGFLMIGMPAQKPKGGRREPVENKVTWIS